TYATVLALFLTLPLGWLLIRVPRDLWRCGLMRRCASFDRRAYGVVLLHVLLALAYTTPWDNYLLARGVWFYDPQKVSGIVLGYVPLEEYGFFVLQTLFTGLWTLALRRRLQAAEKPGLASSALRLGASLGVFFIWACAVGVGMSGWKPGTYLTLILSWGLIPVLIQTAFGADILWAQRRWLAFAIFPPTLYLWLLDWFAISHGVWQLDPLQTTGLALVGLPLEEMLFFLLTNWIIGCGVMLMLSETSHARAQALCQYGRMRWWRLPSSN
ncbi:MAG: lycopene cyclase domain-containing protein, partial [Anaerolineae bacterium]|nr:lycopene cyclase domain-containing protein [Anaerolineae bacterium]MDW8072056.1 lycopene cyclase domain-containing protein [Anaerolineae bacterium]